MRAASTQSRMPCAGDHQAQGAHPDDRLATPARGRLHPLSNTRSLRRCALVRRLRLRHLGVVLRCRGGVACRLLALRCREHRGLGRRRPALGYRQLLLRLFKLASLLLVGAATGQTRA